MAHYKLGQVVSMFFYKKNRLFYGMTINNDTIYSFSYTFVRKAQTL